MNKKRSATAEQLYRQDARLEVRSAGVRREAKRRVSAADLLWADIVFVMERSQQRWLTAQFPDLNMPSMEVLGIPDDYEFMDVELQEMLRLTLDPEIDSLLGTREDPPAVES
jgi:predicted protein tyrosine phosphatase